MSFNRSAWFVGLGLVFVVAACQGRPGAPAAPPSPPPPSAVSAPATQAPVIAPAGTPEARLAAAGWVGSAPCVDCHADIAERFARSAMARAITRTGAKGGHAPLPAAELPHASTGLVYTSRQDADTVHQAETRADASGEPVFHEGHDADLVIGSGAHTMSFMMFGPAPGIEFQMPLTWYPQAKRWDMSPGYTEFNRRFDRRTETKCLFCHNGTPTIHASVREGTGEGWLGIGCERCHGPGRDHAADTKVKPFNPKSVPPAEEEAICEQCHLIGVARVFAADWNELPPDPARPLDEILTIYVPENAEAASNPVVIAGQGDRLRRSACFAKSGGQMRCTSCHDPHAPAATDDATWFRTRCQKCHGPEACTRKPEHGDAGPNADCVSCHMERVGSSDVPHAYGTDHWIRRDLPKRTPKLVVAGQEKAPGSDPETGVRAAHPPRGISAAEAQARLGTARLRVADEHHHEGLLKSGEADVRAALAAEPENALALAGVGHVHALMNEFDAAETHLAKALTRAPALVSVARELASVRMSQGRPGPAAEALAAALPFAGDPSELLVEQAHALTAAGEGRAALVALQRAISLRPSVALIRREAATLMAQLNDPEGAARELLEACRRTLCSVDERRLDATMMGRVGRFDLTLKIVEAARADHPNDTKLREDAAALAKEVKAAATAPPAGPASTGDADADTLTRARALLAARKPAEAVELLSGAVAKRPDAAELHHWLGLATGLTGDMSAAVRHLERASTLSGGADAALLNDLGMAQKSVGRLADAQRTFERITQASPDFAFAWFNLATLLEAQGRRREALGAVEGGLRAAPDDAEGKSQRDALRKALGEPPAAP